MKPNRHAKILEIISVQNIETQDQLQQALASAGVYCTQATISRDINEMGILKEMTALGTYRYVAPTDEVTGTFSTKMNAIFKQSVTNIDYSQNMIVIRTLPGLASAAASAIDSMNLSVVLGTLAGDDTVFAVMRDQNAAAAFYAEIKNLLK